MKGLVADMVKEDPADRPTMEEVVTRFRMIRNSLHWWTLRRPIDRRWYPTVFRVLRMFPAMCRNVCYIIRGISAVPTYAVAEVPR